MLPRAASEISLRWNNAIIQLRNKGNLITFEEEEAVKIAILLHDIGHGPFSHALENSIINNIPHEEISYLFMQRLNEEFSGKLSLAIKIFKNKYKKKIFTSTNLLTIRYW